MTAKIKRKLLSALLLLAGLNLFTACYGTPVKNWEEMPAQPESGAEAPAGTQAETDATAVEAAQTVSE